MLPDKHPPGCTGSRQQGLFFAPAHIQLRRQRPLLTVAQGYRQRHCHLTSQPSEHRASKVESVNCTLTLKCVPPDVTPICSLSPGEIESHGHTQRGIGSGLWTVPCSSSQGFSAPDLSPRRSHGVAPLLLNLQCLPMAHGLTFNLCMVFSGLGDHLTTPGSFLSFLFFFLNVFIGV